MAFGLDTGAESVVSIKVIGVGGGGSNVVNRMVESGVQGVDFIAVNTDKQALSGSSANQKIQIGEKLTAGQGAGSNPDVGRQSAEESRSAISKVLEDTDMVFICDPVNPTGCDISDEILEEILKKSAENDIAVCVDESFMPMSDKAVEQGRIDLAKHINEYDRLYVIRSLTKLFAMPGIRMGYVLSSPEGIEKLCAQLPEWNLPVTAEAAIIEGIKLIKDTSFISDTVKLIKKEREYLTGELTKHGLKIFPGRTSFILCKGPGKLYEKLLERGVLIRDCSEDPGLGAGFFRIAVKDHESNMKLSAIIGEILDKN